MSGMTLQAAVTDALRDQLAVVKVTGYTRLLSSNRNEVARVAVVDADGKPCSWVVKTPLSSPWGVREEAALATMTAAGVQGVPQVIAVLTDPPALVLTDLGAGPTLADRLLGPGAEATEQALREWATALGALHKATSSLQRPFAARLVALSPFGPPTVDPMPERVAQAQAQLPRLLTRLDVDFDVAASSELEAIAVRLSAQGPHPIHAISPGDTCPSNAIHAAHGWSLIDFEEAAFRHVAWDAAYLRVPWPTCWCSWQLPAGVAGDALDAWRRALGLRDRDAVAHLYADVDAATVAWSFLSLADLGPAALDGDPRPVNELLRASTPTRRAMLQHRMRQVASAGSRTFPALRALASQVDSALIRLWGPQSLAPAPAFATP
jgi:hypothetical protein